MILCSRNIFKNIDMKYPILETACDRQIKQEQCILIENHLDDVENVNDVNKVHYLHPNDDPSNAF